MTNQGPRRRGAAVLVLAAMLAACGSSLTPSPIADGTASAVPSILASLDPTGPSETPAASQPAPSASAQGATYVVQSGDTLYSIARSWSTTVGQLQAWNAERYPTLATDPNRLEAGWELIVAGDPSATPLPTPVVTSAPTSLPPVASGCSAGNRVAAAGQHTYAVIPDAGHSVALTLDMGGRLDPGIDILNLLIANKVCVTIFPTGAMTQTNEGQQIMAIIRAHPELFEVGNHTMHHCDLVRGGGGSPTTAPCAGVTSTAQFVQQELTTSEQILQNLAGQNPQPYWRPPYGSISDGVISAAAGAGYTKTFGWDIDTIDWKPISQGGPTAQQIATKVVTNARDGSIVLMHLGGYETLDALQLMIPGLRDRGFLLTSVSDMLN